MHCKKSDTLSLPVKTFIWFDFEEYILLLHYWTLISDELHLNQAQFNSQLSDINARLCEYKNDSFITQTQI